MDIDLPKQIVIHIQKKSRLIVSEIKPMELAQFSFTFTSIHQIGSLLSPQQVDYSLKTF